jgi:hypothetical protein
MVFLYETIILYTDSDITAPKDTATSCGAES